MARVTLPDFRETNEDGSLAPATYTQNAPFEVADTDEVLLAYYQGEGALVERGVHVVARGAMEFDGEKYVEVVDVVELADGELTTLDEVLPAKSANRGEWEQAARRLGVADEAIDAAANKDQLIALVEAAAAALPDEAEPVELAQHPDPPQ